MWHTTVPGALACPVPFALSSIVRQSLLCAFNCLLLGGVGDELSVFRLCHDWLFGICFCVPAVDAIRAQISFSGVCCPSRLCAVMVPAARQPATMFIRVHLGLPT